jgi:hypothetical protein
MERVARNNDLGEVLSNACPVMVRSRSSARLVS